jgi:hypothetical protein
LVGAPLALAAQPLGQPWMFWLGLVFLISALLLPMQPGQRLGDRFQDIVRHLPLSGWLSSRRKRRVR